MPPRARETICEQIFFLTAQLSPQAKRSRKCVSMSRPTVRRRYRIDSECLTLSKVQADLKRAGRRTSAFAFESFATASFDAVLADEEVRGEVEAITHATQQVDVRLRIVQQHQHEHRDEG